MTRDPVLLRRSSAVVEPPGSEVAAHLYRHLFEHAGPAALSD